MKSGSMNKVDTNALRRVGVPRVELEDEWEHEQAIARSNAMEWRYDDERRRYITQSRRLHDSEPASKIPSRSCSETIANL